MLCLGCFPDSDYVKQNGDIVIVNIGENACDKLEEQCTKCIEDSQNTHDWLKEVKDLADSYLAELQADAPAETQTEDVEKEPPRVKCGGDSGTSCRDYICVTLPAEKGFAPNPETMSEPAQGPQGRRLASNVSIVVSPEGYNSYDVGTSEEADTEVVIEGFSSSDAIKEDEDFGRVLGGLLLVIGLVL